MLLLASASGLAHVQRWFAALELARWSFLSRGMSAVSDSCVAPWAALELDSSALSAEQQTDGRNMERGGLRDSFPKWSAEEIGRSGRSCPLFVSVGQS